MVPPPKNEIPRLVVTAHRKVMKKEKKPYPANFRYRDVYEKGKPDHSTMDSFAIKHPPMPLSRRAKIFSPFDALKGFSEELKKRESE